MTTEDKYDWIERYLDRQLTPDELKSFEAELEKDSALREEVALHRQAAETLKGEKVHELRTVLQRIDQGWKNSEDNQPPRVVNINYRRLMAIAAIALALIVAWQLFGPGLSEPSNEALFVDNFQPYQMVLNQRNLSEEGKTELLGDAISAYSKGDYQSAADLFKELSTLDPKNTAFRMYQAVSDLATGNVDAAIPVFKSLIETPDVLFAEQSRWYLALAYLKKGDAETAKMYLSNIQSGQFKHRDARQLIKQIE